jgi:hypothetical protein
MSTAELEDRVVNLERKVTDLAKQVAGGQSQDINAWIDEIHGTFKNDATNRRAARFGRDRRKSQRPARSRARKVSSK